MPPDLTKPLPTKARLSLGRTSATISTQDQIQFQLDHALARDAVHTQLDVASLADGLRTLNLEPILVRSAVEPTPTNRRAYLRRPDLGRKLHPDSAKTLEQAAASTPPHPSQTTIALILADGLSSLAVERHALPLLAATFPLIPNPYALPGSPASGLGSRGWLIPVAQNARVALADEIGHLLHADLTILLIGERPGLSSPDSLGVYLTWDPHPGRTDAERNCISNIRGPEGLSYAEAAHRIAHYIAEATRLQTTGISLKDPTQTLKLDAQ
jgi:ethanolamine ammonia-lyase small subunit